MLSKPRRVQLAVSALVLSAALSARAEVRLHGLFSDHMVLQQGQPLKVWGWADPGEQVTISVAGSQARATAGKEGRWMVTLPAQKAGGPHTLTASGRNTITLSDVMIGEVWIASGQSNMEWPLRASFDAANEIAKAANPQLRLFTVPKLKADAPMDNVTNAWHLCSPASVSNFSAVACYFGRDLQQARGVAVGLIHTSWGGSPAEVWMSERVLRSNPDYRRDILDAYPEQKRRSAEALARWEKDKAEADKAGRPFSVRRPGTPWKPTELYNGMIAPLIPFPIKGAIWYQGESNAGRAHQYRALFADLIKNWRRDWGLGNFTFLEVQLAPFMAIKDQPGDSTWAELREAQLLATKNLPKVGLAVITDVGDEKDIHPKKKEPVGARLALAARAIAYGEKVVHSGPEFRSLRVKGHEAILSFAHVGGGLEARGGELKGFAIAGQDRKFVWARARIEGNKVIVSSPAVPKPVAVRYGWADYPVVNLWNKDGLPATPFRTDDWPMITAPKKETAKK
jgi:sialate O-acetylesterase